MLLTQFMLHIHFSPFLDGCENLCCLYNPNFSVNISLCTFVMLWLPNTATGKSREAKEIKHERERERHRENHQSACLCQKRERERTEDQKWRTEVMGETERKGQ